MSNPLAALQTGLYSRLTGFSALTTLLGAVDEDGLQKVYDHVPQGRDAPYVVIGDDTTAESDTKSNNGWEVTITIHCWDFEKAGRLSVKNIMKEVYNALHKQESNITVTGFGLVLLYCTEQFSFQEEVAEGAGDHYYHGVQRFRAIIRA